MEKGLEGLEARWQSIDWLKDNYKVSKIVTLSQTVNTTPSTSSHTTLKHYPPPPLCDRHAHRTSTLPVTITNHLNATAGHGRAASQDGRRGLRGTGG